MKPHLHFMGIGGVMMSGLAKWYAQEGYSVSGCDSGESSELATLRAMGITVQLGHDPSHLQGTDVLVHTAAIAEHESELVTARKQGLKVLRRIELLGELLEHRSSVTITGTHGKSTTTGMIATVFMEAGQDPSILIGAHLPSLGSNVRYGQGPHLIAEVDESDTGFARLTCDLAVLTNLEDDHIAGAFSERRTYHASRADLDAATRQFASGAKSVLYCADWPELGALLADHPNAVTYGFAQTAAYRAEITSLGAHGSSFVLHTPEGEMQRVTLCVPGEHNVQNATAALAAAHLSGIALPDAAEGLARYRGIGRRWQRHGSVNGALVIDDYAHHPTEVKATLRAARHTGRRVRAVLQPHRWVRTAQLWPELADAASLADEVLVLGIYSAGEQAIPGISSDLIVDRLNRQGKHSSLHDLSSAQRYLAESLQENDLVITLGAGDVWKVAAGLVTVCGGDDGTA